jgi:putative ATP-dependent endonuclease of the OLD family
VSLLWKKSTLDILGRTPTYGEIAVRLRELTIRNFRKIETLTVSFPRGLCVIIGENNTGKTAIIDALRLMLMPSREFDALRLSEEDFRIGTEFAPIEISCTFIDASDAEEVDCHECLVDIGEGKFEVRLNARVEFNKTTRRANLKMWGGETEGGSLPSNFYDHIAAIYLQPLRDPESGLRPGRYSQIARLVDCLTEESEQKGFEAIAVKANDDIRQLQPVKDAQKDINDQMGAIAGLELAQNTNLVFSDPTFYRIIAGLQPLIDSLPFTLNGLGYNNLIYTSATLGTLRKSQQYAFRTILIEEPEAHLHPQLQDLLLSHLASEATAEKNPVQVIVTSHSPILASQAPIDSVVSIHEHNGLVSSVSVCDISFSQDLKETAELKKKLQRYLDATRAELFFARRVLIVEGIAEALLIPVLAKMAGGSLKRSAVTIVNADGLNFNAFLPLFGQGKLGIPIGILTDGDSKNGELSDTAKGLKAQQSRIPNLHVQCCEVTFEHELARCTGLLPHMLDALGSLHPLIAKKLTEKIAALTTDDARANAFYEQIIESGVSKGRFAQELALRLETAGLGLPAVPKYVREVLTFLQVLPVGGVNGPTGNTA